MNLEESLEVFPYLGFLIRELRRNWQKSTLIERSEGIEKINKELQNQHDLVQGTHRAQQIWINLSKETCKDYDEFVKHRRGRPMMLNNPLKVQKWMQEQLDEQRFNFLFKDIIFQLKHMDVEQTNREMKALHEIFEYMNEITELMITQFKKESKKIAAEIAELKERHKRLVLKRINDLQKETGIKVVKVRM